MNRREHEAVIRFRKYKKEAEPSNWYRSKLMLYFPWYNEESDLLGGYSTYEEHYHHIRSIVVSNEKKYNKSDIDGTQLDENSPPEHAWNQIAPGSEASRAQSLAEGSETLTALSEQDTTDSAKLFTSTTISTLHARFESAANREEIPSDEYRKLLRDLNTKQRQIVMFHRNWYKKAVIALKQPLNPIVCL